MKIQIKMAVTLYSSTEWLRSMLLQWDYKEKKKKKEKQVQGYILYSFQQVKYDFRKFILKHQYPLVAGLYWPELQMAL